MFQLRFWARHSLFNPSTTCIAKGGVPVRLGMSLPFRPIYEHRNCYDMIQTFAFGYATRWSKIIGDWGRLFLSRLRIGFAAFRGIGAIYNINDKFDLF